jgi:hypothetical protein
VDADLIPHPPWCIPAYCTIDRPPLHGHVIAAHRSGPTAIEALVIRLVQAPGTSLPRMELRFGDDRMQVPLLVAQSLAPAIDDLLEAAGVGL